MSRQSLFFCPSQSNACLIITGCTFGFVVTSVYVSRSGRSGIRSACQRSRLNWVSAKVAGLFGSCLYNLGVRRQGLFRNDIGRMDPPTFAAHSATCKTVYIRGIVSDRCCPLYARQLPTGACASYRRPRPIARLTLMQSRWDAGHGANTQKRYIHEGHGPIF